ncbi:MAG: hypothetical protein GDA44_13610 [Prochloron sp. SP5CPC1]|nr:hypothetical protein [Candidatus Paraprochloron terpiosi SP5CPC1]
MSNIKTEIQSLASQAARLSQEAQSAFAERNFTVGRSLMKQAVDAGRNCQHLIQQYNEQRSPTDQGVKVR